MVLSSRFVSIPERKPTEPNTTAENIRMLVSTEQQERFASEITIWPGQMWTFVVEPDRVGGQTRVGPNVGTIRAKQRREKFNHLSQAHGLMDLGSV